MNSAFQISGPPDPKATRMVQEIKHTSPLLGCRVAPSGRFVFAGAQDKSIQRFELATGKMASMEGHESWVRALAFPSAGQQLVSGDYIGRLIWWNAEDEKPAPVRTIE